MANEFKAKNPIDFLNMHGRMDLMKVCLTGLAWLSLRVAPILAGDAVDGLNGKLDFSGDSDFVPAAKLARREGIDFILDPMWATIRDDLHEHIDGLRTVIQRPSIPAAAPLANPAPPCP